MGDIRFVQDGCYYQIGDGPVQEFDPDNPPVVAPGTLFIFMPRWKNYGDQGLDYTFRCSVYAPTAAPPVTFHCDPSQQRLLQPGETDGIDFHFEVPSYGDCSAWMEVYHDDPWGEPGNTWSPVVCTVAGGGIDIWSAVFPALSFVVMMGIAAIFIRALLKRKEGG